MKVTQGSDTATLDFELPAYNTEAVVTSVDMSKNKITVVGSGKTQKPVTPGTYNVANKYDGNLGELVGRAVTFGYDSDSNMTSFTLLDQQVVYGCMKGFKPSNDVNAWYYKDALSGEKYNCKATADATASIRPTMWIPADADTATTTAEYSLAANNDNTAFGYVKLVLNPDGSVATATVEKTLPNKLYVKEVDGTIVKQDEDKAFDLDGYTIVEDGNYIAASDLVEGDILFLNNTHKFADVYVNAVSGEISNVIDGKLSINGKAYTWYDAQYWDAENEKFGTLATNDHDTETGIVAIQNSQKYLNTLDPEEDTTIYLGRDGNIKYLEGTPVEEAVTTTRELIVGTAKGYTQSLDNHIRVPAFDGTEDDTIDVVDSKIKTMFGDKGKVTWDGTGAPNPDDGTSVIKFEDKDDDAPKTDYDFDNTALNVVFTNTQLVDVQRNAEGVVTGFKPLDARATGDATTALTYAPVTIRTIDGKAYNDATASDITASTKKITTSDGKTLSLGSYTNIWYHYTDKTDNNKITGKKWALAEFPSAAVHEKANTYLVYADGTKATDIVVIGASDNVTIKNGDTSTYSGIIIGHTKKNDSSDKNRVNTIKMILTDGTTETFDVAEDAAIFKWVDTALNPGQIDDGEKTPWDIENNAFFATVSVKDSDEVVTQVVVDMKANANGWTDNTDYLKANRTQITSKLVTANNKELTVSDPAALLLKYKEEGSWKYKPVTYAEINTTGTIVTVWYHTNYTDAATKIEADMIVVTDTGSDGTEAETGTKVTVTTAAELDAAAALADSDTTIVVDGDIAADKAIDTVANITINKGHTLALSTFALDCAKLTVNGTLTTKAAMKPTGNIAVGADGKIDILANTGSLDVTAGTTLTNKGTIKTAGALTNKGTLVNEGTISVTATGSLVNNGPKITNKNGVAVAAGGTITNTAGTWDGTGVYTVNDATAFETIVKAGTTFTTALARSATLTTATQTWTSAVTVGAGVVLELDDSVTTAGPRVTVASTGRIIIPDGGTLSIPATGRLENTGEITVGGGTTGILVIAGTLNNTGDIVCADKAEVDVTAASATLTAAKFAVATTATNGVTFKDVTANKTAVITYAASTTGDFTSATAPDGIKAGAGAFVTAALNGTTNITLITSDS